MKTPEQESAHNKALGLIKQAYNGLETLSMEELATLKAEAIAVDMPYTGHYALFFQNLEAIKTRTDELIECANETKSLAEGFQERLKMTEELQGIYNIAFSAPYVRTGAVLANLGLHEEAENAFQTALEKAPRHLKEEIRRYIADSQVQLPKSGQSPQPRAGEPRTPAQ